VLHFVGAKDAFIASQFQRHFLVLGLEGGVLGGGLAILSFGLIGLAGGWSRGTPGGDQLAMLFGAFDLGIAGYAVIMGQIVLMAAVAALTSRHTVNSTLRTVE
jgi:cell division transport system permease protein